MENIVGALRELGHSSSTRGGVAHVLFEAADTIEELQKAMTGEKPQMSEKPGLVTVRITAKNGQELYVGDNSLIGQVELYSGIGAMTTRTNIEGIQLIAPVHDSAYETATEIARNCWNSQNEVRRKSGAPEIELDQGICDQFARALAHYIWTTSDDYKPRNESPKADATIEDPITALDNAEERFVQCMAANNATTVKTDRIGAGGRVIFTAEIVTAEELERREAVAAGAERKLAFLKEKGLTVGTMHESGKEPRLMYVIESGSELDDLEIVNRLIDAEIEANVAKDVAEHWKTQFFEMARSGAEKFDEAGWKQAAKNWQESANQYSRNADYWVQILQGCYNELPDEMKRRCRMNDEGGMSAEPHLSKLPEIVKFLADQAYTWIPGMIVRGEVTEERAQSIIDGIVQKLAAAGLGIVGDGTVHGNGIMIDRLRIRDCGPATDRIPSEDDNPKGLHSRYVVSRTDGRTEPNAVYFVLRLDGTGVDPIHVEACRAAAAMYSTVVGILPGSDHLHQMAKELDELVDKIGKERSDFPGFLRAELRDMVKNPTAIQTAADYNSAKETEADAFGAMDSAGWHGERRVFLTRLASGLMPF